MSRSSYSHRRTARAGLKRVSAPPTQPHGEEKVRRSQRDIRRNGALAMGSPSNMAPTLPRGSWHAAFSYQTSLGPASMFLPFFVPLSVSERG